MIWQSEWRALAARITAVIEAAEHLVQARRDDDYGTSNSTVIPQAAEVMRLLCKLRDDHRASLPAGVTGAIDRYAGILKRPLDGQNGLPGVVVISTVFPALRGELNYLMASSDAIAVHSVERAFQHLQRTIIADDDAAKRWQQAFAASEPACEKLGAVHLLLHGIWAFKADAKGERTDLVLGTRMTDVDAGDVALADSVLALTEWKLVRAAGDLVDAIARAETQAKLYAFGSLGAMELQSTRFIVIVSEDRLSMPANKLEGGITYRHVNVAVRPSSPSKSPI